jgi:hypothetical protein
MILKLNILHPWKFKMEKKQNEIYWKNVGLNKR